MNDIAARIDEWMLKRMNEDDYRRLIAWIFGILTSSFFALLLWIFPGILVWTFGCVFFFAVFRDVLDED